MTGSIRDNLLYRSHKREALIDNMDQLQSIAQENRSIELPGSVRLLLSECIAENSRRGYSSDLRRFHSWGGSIPSDARIIAIYLAEHAHTHSTATLRRWTASLSRAHAAGGYSDPTKLEPARSTLRGICRSKGQGVRNAAPLLRDDVLRVLDALGETTRDKRDRALLLLGFAGGFRRIELVGLNFADVEFVRRGMLIDIRRSKTDQTGVGRKIGVPFGKTRHCPVAALETWLEASLIRTGPLFRSVTRYGDVSEKRLSGEAVSIIVKERVSKIGIDPSDYSGHSLRAGFATSAALAGVSSWKIRQQTGHASDAMLARYIRSAELFEGNAAGAIL